MYKIVESLRHPVSRRLLLRFYLHPVLESEPDVLPAVHHGIIVPFMLQIAEKENLFSIANSSA